MHTLLTAHYTVYLTWSFFDELQSLSLITPPSCRNLNQNQAAIIHVLRCNHIQLSTLIHVGLIPKIPWAVSVQIPKFLQMVAANKGRRGTVTHASHLALCCPGCMARTPLTPAFHSDCYSTSIQDLADYQTLETRLEVATLRSEALQDAFTADVRHPWSCAILPWHLSLRHDMYVQYV